MILKYAIALAILIILAAMFTWAFLPATCPATVPATCASGCTSQRRIGAAISLLASADGSAQISQIRACSSPAGSEGTGPL